LRPLFIYMQFTSQLTSNSSFISRDIFGRQEMGMSSESACLN
jgi:hypothetical protein